jgi:hypothetical protein
MKLYKLFIASSVTLFIFVFSCSKDEEMNAEICSARNTRFTLEMANKLDTTVYLVLYHGSVSYYSPTTSMQNNPGCYGNRCCLFNTDIGAAETYNFDASVTSYIIKSIAYSEEELDPNDEGISLFDSKAGSNVKVEIRGIVLDSLIITYSN